MAKGRLNTVAVSSVLFGLLASGCIDAINDYHAFEMDAQYVNPGVFPGVYSAPDGGSVILNPGILRAAKPVIVHLKSERPAYAPGADGVTQEAYVQISLAYWLPENYTEKMPVIVDAGPYFEAGTHCEPDPNNCQFNVNNTIAFPSQTTPFSLKNYLPHGYAVAQVAIRGTGTSGGCMELMGPNEVADLNQAITWLATQPWSNGHVAMQGGSYDGSTPWMVAGTGNPHLKTIVPTAGLPDIFDLMFHNGSAERRGSFMQQRVYWPYGFSPNYPGNVVSGGGVANGRADYQNRQNLLCPEAWEGAAVGPGAEVSGGRLDPASTYWRERDYRDDVLKNYKGSIFLVHGFQDWNVDPHAAIPFNAQLRDAGFKMKELYGQWGHASPDSTCGARAPKWAWVPCRFDYAEILFRWFEHELKGNTTQSTGPSVQVQDNRGFWRNTESYPPTDVEWLKLYPVAGQLVEAPGAVKEVTLYPPVTASRGPAHYLEFRTERLESDLRISGLPQFHVQFEPMGPGGYLGAWLFDENQTGMVLERKGFTDPYGKPTSAAAGGYPQVIGWAQMDLRYHEGGDAMSERLPGKKYVAKMQFEPLDVLVPAGHRLTLWVFQYHFSYDRIASRVHSPAKVFLGGPDTVLRLPVPDVDTADVFPVPGSHLPTREFFEFFNIAKPRFSTVIPPPGSDLSAAACGAPWSLWDPSRESNPRLVAGCRSG